MAFAGGGSLGAAGASGASALGGKSAGSGDILSKLLPLLSLSGGKKGGQEQQQPAFPPDLRSVGGGNIIPLPAPEAAIQPERQLEPLPVLAMLLEQNFI